MAYTDEPIFYTTRKRTPSVETIAKAFTLSIDVAEKVRGVLTGKVDLMTVESARRRQEQAYNNHDPLTLALEAINELIGGYGVEYIAHKKDGFRDVYGLEYINFGDTYDTTFIYNHMHDSWSIGCWGDFVERNSNYR